MNDGQKRDNSGALFRNDRKTKENQPSHTGIATIGGVDYYISAWVKEGRSGKFFSLAFSKKGDERNAAPPVEDDFDGRPPF